MRIMTKAFLLPLLLAALLAGCGLPLSTAPTAGPEANPTIEEPELAETMAALIATASAVPGSPTPAPQGETAVPAPTQAPAGSWVALTAPDRNIWLVNSETSEMRQVTFDATPFDPGTGQDTVEYSNPRWSSDGRFLAYQRQASQPVPDGLQFEYSFLVYDTETGQERAVLPDSPTAGYDWQPGTHLLTFALPADMNYFATRGTVNPDLARGIWAYDAGAQGEPYDLVRPENGRTLVAPKWSPDGGYLGFDEVILMEGRGMFAWYDVAAGQYHALEQQVGTYDWMPGGGSIVYDMLTYAPNGTERIGFINLADKSARALLPEIEGGYAFAPALSPDGQQVAFMVGTNPDEGVITYTLMVQPSAGGEPRSLGVFEYLDGLDWSSDGAYLVFSSGTYERRQVVAVRAADGAIRVLAPGWQPAWQP